MELLGTLVKVGLVEEVSASCDEEEAAFPPPPPLMAALRLAKEVFLGKAQGPLEALPFACVDASPPEPSAPIKLDSPLVPDPDLP
jgi:hypothetical protein